MLKLKVLRPLLNKVCPYRLVRRHIRAMAILPDLKIPTIHRLINNNKAIHQPDSIQVTDITHLKTTLSTHLK